MRHASLELGKIRFAFADRKVGTKIGLGFACTLVISGLAFGVTWFSFRSSQDAFERYTQQVTAADTVRDLHQAFIDLRRSAREYAFTGVESNVEQAGTLRSVLDKLVRQAADQINDVESDRRVETVAHQLQAYGSAFDKVVVQKRELTNLETGRLDPLGAAGVRDFETLVGAATAVANLDRIQFANQALKQFMTARIDVNKFLGRSDTAAGKDAEKKFNDLVATLSEPV